MAQSEFPIGVVERETNISKETLRKWEERYGFPSPTRNRSGIRMYSREDLARLHAVKRLVDCGMRPAQAVAMDSAESAAFLSSISARYLDHPAPEHQLELGKEIINALASSDTSSCQKILDRERRHRAVQDYVICVIKPLIKKMGQAWAEGEISIRHEHLFAESVQVVLRNCMATLPEVENGPAILLATPPGELHTLGLLMLHTLLKANNVRGVFLGAQLPAREVAAAVKDFQADIAAVSISAAFPQSAVKPFLLDVRHQLPRNIPLWAGGDGVARVTGLPRGIVRFSSLTATLIALQELRPEARHER